MEKEEILVVGVGGSGREGGEFGGGDGGGNVKEVENLGRGRRYKWRTLRKMEVV